MNRWLVRGLVTAGFAGGIWLLSAGAAQADHCGCPDTGSSLPLGVVSGLLSSIDQPSSSVQPPAVTAQVRVQVGATTGTDTENAPASTAGAVKASALVRVASGSEPSTGGSQPSAAVAAMVDLDATMALGVNTVAGVVADVSAAPEGGAVLAASLDSGSEPSTAASVELLVAASLPVADIDTDADTDAGNGNGSGSGVGTDSGIGAGSGGGSAGIDLTTGLAAAFGPSVDAATAARLAIGAAALASTGVTWSRSLLLGAMLLAAGLLMYCAGTTPAQQTQV
jgi:hypothetical protein